MDNNWKNDLAEFYSAQLRYFTSKCTNVKPKGMSRFRLEVYLSTKFNIINTFKAHHLRNDPLCRCDNDDLLNPLKKSFVFSDNSYMVIFPNDGVRISSTKNFILSVPALKGMFSDNWEKNTFQLKYYDYNIEQEFNGPKLYISYSPLDMFIYDAIPEDLKEKIKNEHDETREEMYNQNSLLESIRHCIRYIG
jgi:hypothetical protein